MVMTDSCKRSNKRRNVSDRFSGRVTNTAMWHCVCIILKAREQRLAFPLREWPVVNKRKFLVSYSLQFFPTTNCMEQCPSWEANSFSASQISCIYGILRFITAFTSACHLFLSRARSCEMFRNMAMFVRWGVVNTSPNSLSWSTSSCPLTATAYSVYSQLPSICGGRSSVCNLKTRRAVVTATTCHGFPSL